MSSSSGGRGGSSRARFRFSLAVYRLLLLRYPVSIRLRYGRDMADLFEMQLVDAVDEKGPAGWLSCWARVLRELIGPASPSLWVGGAVPGDRDGQAASGGLDTTSAAFVAGALEDLRFAWRSLRREPAFAGLLVAVLGIGVAVNTSVFTVVHAYLLRPLPYPAPERVVTIRAPVQVTVDDVADLFEARVTWDLDAFTLLGEDGPELARGAWVTPDFLDVYGVEPALGRVFLPEEGGPGATRSVAILSHRLWQTRYGGSPDVLGRTVSAYTSDRPDDAEAFTIVGVLPRDFWHFNDYTDILVPLREDRAIYAGRLLPGVTPEAASDVITRRVVARSTSLPDRFTVQVVRTHDLHVASVRPTLWTLQTAALLVFLIACANAAVLILVRSVRREQELGVRRALGAAGGRLARQLVLEGALLAAGAGLLGVLLAIGGMEIVRGGEALSLWRSIPGGVDALRLDFPVLAATLALCGVTGIAFGMVPLLTSRGSRLATSLSEVGRGGSDTRGRRRVRAGLLCLEVGFSVALLTGAGLMIQSALHLQRTDLGFQASGIARGQVGLRQASYPEPGQRIAFFRELTDRAAGQPGVESVGLVSAVPFTWFFNERPLEAEDGRAGGGIVVVADGSYFETMSIDLVRGRTFGPDDQGGALVAVVSESVAERLWPGEDPLGRRFREAEEMGMEPGAEEEPAPWYSVVGVVRDVRQGVSPEPSGDVYLSFEQTAPFWSNVVVRTRAGAGSPLPALERSLAEIDTDVPLSSAGALDDIVVRAIAPSRFLATLFATFAAFALVLSVVGLYGVMSYTARQSRRDVAIRMALGANGAEVRRWFLGQAAVVLGIGLALGLFGGVRIGDALEGQLHGVAPRDPTTLLAVTLLLGGTALIAVWLPARRAARAAPALVLRQE